MTENQYLSLCEAYLQGTCTQEEENLLIAYQQEKGLTDIDFSVHNNQIIKETIKSRIQQSIKSQKKPLIKLRLFNWKVAASIAALFVVTTYFLVRNTNESVTKAPKMVAKAETKKAIEILPGSTKATLTLADGKSIDLTSSKNGVISTQNNSNITKSGNGLVVSGSNNNSITAANTLNKITIPRGGKYDVVLPDGTHVWLNSSSSLSFPNAFAGNERKVFLTGEAYFEVAKNKEKPFKVDVAGKQVIEVLGTHFNVTAFENDKFIETTLLEGSVKINYNKSNIKIIPGQMAVNNLKDNLKIIPADVDEVMAWTNEMFVFKNENINSIMKKVSRWYDVDVDFKGDVSAINFEGNYARSKSLKSLLKNFELTDKVHFKIEGRRITVIAK
ncbi:FecR family protein [Pedobacter jejuensis]|uniref:FecR family protein n=1 Tax=Pedobacter jejuensis TaxID=1268550 RepID=A0A3N0C0Q6_9SPHI|nr:FecR family protein [Pedobacter jejuensis]RNL55793.1 FecR family protein [Pedobacter jejuensis]